MVVTKNESVQCSHCSKMHTGTAWFSQCCWNKSTNKYKDVSVLNDGAHCMLCNGCMSKLRNLGELEDFNYHEEFEFKFTYEEQARRVSKAVQERDDDVETLAYDDEESDDDK